MFRIIRVRLRRLRVRFEELPLAGKAVLLLEDEVLISMNVKSDLQDAGDALVNSVSSVAEAQTAIGQVGRLMAK